jgi:hypothetical protein
VLRNKIRFISPRRRLLSISPDVSVNDHPSYCSFAYSNLACFRIGMSGSASFNIKLRANDGACVGTTCTFAVGSNPAGVAFDGAYIWVANSGSNNLVV